MTKYTIKRRDEETECCYCAYPLFIGDKAYMSADEQSVYCSKVCAGVEEPKPHQMIDQTIYDPDWEDAGVQERWNQFVGAEEPKRSSMIEADSKATYGKREPKGVQAGCFDV